MSNLLNGYGYRLVARIGNAADIPALIPGEAGWDVDLKTFRMGDDTAQPARIPSTKSIGDFDFSVTGGRFKFAHVDLPVNGTVDGVDISKLNLANGFLVRKANNDYANVTLVSGDNSLQIINGSGIAGNVDIRIHPDILELINSGGYLQSVTTSAIMTGDGRSASPLSVKAMSTTQVGVTRAATAAETSAGASQTIAVTPYSLTHLVPGSPLVVYLQSLFETDFVLKTDQTMSGSGNVGSPLTVVQATETQRGAAEIATAAELNAGASATTMITPAKLKGLTSGSPMALALKTALGVGDTYTLADLRMTGPGVVGRTNATANQAPQVLPFATRAKITEGDAANGNDVVRQLTMREFFPSGIVRTGAAPTNALPAPASVGKGSIAFDDNKQNIVLSNGAAWIDPSRSSSEGMYTLMSVFNMVVNTVYTVNTALTKRRVMFTTTAANLSMTGLNGWWSPYVQLNIGGVWTNLTFDAPLSVYPWPSVSWLDIQGPGGVNVNATIIPPLYAMVAPNATGRCIKIGGNSLNPMGQKTVTDLGAWNGQVKAVGVGAPFVMHQYDPYYG